MVEVKRNDRGNSLSKASVHHSIAIENKVVRVREKEIMTPTLVVI
jgi:hypothetical protein